MIFSRFFSPSHSSNDPDTRIKAIEKLSPQSPNERRILHELAFNDEVAEVSLAALAKLDSFALWLKMSQIARNPKLISAAQARVECALIDGCADISTTELKEYLFKSAPAEQIVKCFPLMTELHQDVSFSVKLINRVARSQFTQQVLMSSPETALKLALIELSEDEDLLQKVLKKTRDNTLSMAIEQRICHLEELAKKPVLLRRDVTLVLSKLLALLEKSDYELIESQRDSLVVEYRTLEQDFAVLDTDERQAFTQKLAALQDRIDSLLARLYPDWQASVQAQLHQQAIMEADVAIGEVKRQHKQLQGEQILSLTLGEVSVFQQAVERAENALSTLQQFETPSQQIESLLESYRHIWDRLPELQRQVESLQQLLTEWQQLVENKEHSWTLADIKSVWKAQTSEMAVLPDFLQQQWRSITEQLKLNEQGRKTDQQRDLKHCRKHINIITNLVEQGRYRAAMARFQRLEEDYQALPQATQQLLSKRFEQTREQISRLEGWQTYLAAPRKPELIEQAKALLTESPQDMPARARSIKYLRQQWLTLGKTQQPDDEALNQQFDDILEAAFEPCRNYYAAIEKQQNEAAQARQALICAVQTLAVDEVSDEDRYQGFESLKKQWQQAAQTDSERYKQLRESWDAACAVLTDKLTPWLTENRRLKQSLVDEVTALTDVEDTDVARQQAMAAQEKWKSLGPAGKRYESKLWFAFRAANDKIFSRAKSELAERKAEQSAAATQWLSDLEAVQALLGNSQLDEAQAGLKGLELRLNAMTDRASQKQLKRQFNALKAQLTQATAAEHQRCVQADIERLIDTLGQQNTSDAIEASGFKYLPSTWFGAEKVADESDWLKILITAEVLVQTSSTENDASLRSTIQLQLMQTKLNGESLPDIDRLIAQLVSGVKDLPLNATNYRQRLHDLLLASIEEAG